MPRSDTGGLSCARPSLRSTTGWCFVPADFIILYTPYCGRDFGLVAAHLDIGVHILHPMLSWRCLTMLDSGVCVRSVREGSRTGFGKFVAL